MIEKILFAGLIFVFTASGIKAQTWTKASAAAWFNKQEWLSGLKLIPDQSIDQVQFAIEYHKHKKWWDEAIAYLKNTDFSALKVGNYPIDGEDVYAKVTENASRNIDSTRWELHDNYHDLHYVVYGKELVGITPVGGLRSVTAYDAKNDIRFYEGQGPYYLESPDRFFIMFTGQAHRPFLKVGGYEKAKRIVIKIRYTK